MKTKYIITTTNPDHLDPEDFVDELQDCIPNTSKSEAIKDFKSLVDRTNMRVYLLKVELLHEAEGTL